MAKSARPNGPVNCMEEMVPPWPMALAMGSAHQVYIRLSASVTAMAARPVRASLTTSHRVRVMPWVQASRQVPVSSSRAISGAPQKMPVITGAARMSPMPSVYINV